MKVAAIVILLTLILAVPVAGSDLDKEEKWIDKTDEVLTHYQYFERVNAIYFDGLCWYNAYFYPEMLDSEYLSVPFSSERIGEYVYNETHEEGIGFNITGVWYRNWTDDAGTFALWMPMNLTFMTFGFAGVSTTYYNVGAGLSYGMSGHAQVQESAVRDRKGVGVQFEFFVAEAITDYVGCEFAVAINITALFVTTYEFHEYMLGGCIPEYDILDFVKSLAGAILVTLCVIGGGAFAADYYDKRRNEAEKSRLE